MVAVKAYTVFLDPPATDAEIVAAMVRATLEFGRARIDGMTGHVSAEQSANSLPLSWQRLLALSGVAFAVLFLVGWFASGGDAPDYGASDQDWTSWASDNQWKSRIGAFAMLLAGFVFLHFAATIRTALGGAGRSHCLE